MSIKSTKKFIKDHKKEVIAGTIAIAGATALAVFGVKHRMPKLSDSTDMVDPKFLDLLNTVDKACEGCTMYAPTTLEELIVDVDNARVIDNNYFFEGQDKKLFKIENIIVFGNVVET